MKAGRHEIIHHVVIVGDIFKDLSYFAFFFVDGDGGEAEVSGGTGDVGW
jgi:hypothetical protein